MKNKKEEKKEVVEFNANEIVRVASLLEKKGQNSLEWAKALHYLANSKTLTNQLRATNDVLQREIVKNRDRLVKTNDDVAEIKGKVVVEKELADAEIELVKKECAAKVKEIKNKIKAKDLELGAELVAVAEEVAGKIKIARKSEREANERAVNAVSKAQKAEADYESVVKRISGGLVNAT